MIIKIDDALVENFRSYELQSTTTHWGWTEAYLLKKLLRARVPSNVSKRKEGYERVS